MSLRVAFQMEPLSEVDKEESATFALMLESQARGHRLYHFEPRNLSLQGDKVFARACQVTLDLEQNTFYTLGDPETLNLAEIDVVQIRQDPPFNMEYITTTYLLERIHPETLVVNDPFWIRNSPEKLFPFDWQEFMPPTLVTSNIEEARSFWQEHNEVVIKPLYDFGGNDIFRIGPESQNFEQAAELFAKQRQEAFMLQPFIPEILTEGNKRILFLDGEVAGVFIVRPGEGEFRIYRESTNHPYELNARDKEICAAIGPELKKRGLIFVGIDIIGDTLTEINTTSIGSVRKINKLYDIQFEKQFWDVVEGKLN